MKINITGNNLDLTPAIKTYVEERLASLEKLLAKYDVDSLQANVVLARTTKHHNHGDVHQAEINISIPGAQFNAKADGDDVRATFDAAKDKLWQELVKHKEQTSGRNS